MLTNSILLPSQAIVPLGVALVYLVLCFYLLLRGKLDDSIGGFFAAFLFLSVLWNVNLVAAAVNVPGVPSLNWTQLASYGLIILGMVYWAFARAFLQRSGAALWGWAIGVVGLALAVSLDMGWLVLPPEAFAWSYGWIHTENVAFILSSAWWSLFMVFVVVMTQIRFFLIQNPTHKNRIQFLFISTLLQALGFLMYLSLLEPFWTAGLLVTCLGGILTTYIVTVEDLLVDLIPGVGCIINFLVVTLVTAVVNIAGIYLGIFLGNLTDTIFLSRFLNPLLLIVPAALLTLIYGPIRQISQRLVNRLVFGQRHNHQVNNSAIGIDQTTKNPYIAGPPITKPNLFFGRQSDIQKIIGLLTGNFVMVIGARRIGKTSLLHQLVYHLPKLKDTSEQFIPVLINVEGTPEIEFFHTIMEEIVEVVQKHLLTKTFTNLSFDLSNPNYSPRSFSRDLQLVLRNLQSTTQKPSRLVLLLDEMDTLNTFSLETQSQLRRIFQRFANRNLSVVVAGVKLQRHWAGESSPFYNMFMPVELTSFPEAEARRLITEPVKGIYNYSDEAITRILEATMGLPHRIQQLCLETINHLQATSKKRINIKIEDVDAVLQTIHWLDEEILLQDETAISSVSHQSPVIAEEKTSYQTENLEPDDKEVI